MNILPKVYRFVFITKDGRPGTAFVVARNTVNAEQRFKQLSNKLKKKDRTNLYVVMAESWIANLLVLFLPKYTYRGSKWSEWKKIK